MSDPKIVAFGKRFNSEDEIRAFLAKYYGAEILQDTPNDKLAELIYFRTNWDYYEKECAIGLHINEVNNEYVMRVDRWWKERFGDESYEVIITDDYGMYN